MISITSIGEFLVICFFGIWTLLSLLVLFPRFKVYLRKRDWFLLVPEWRFFAPRPAQTDFHLLYRDRFPDGSVTEWTEVELISERGWGCVIWNPRKRRSKALFDAIIELSSLTTLLEEKLVYSTAYLALLNYISNRARSISPEFTQFLIILSYGSSQEKEPDIMYLSRLHLL